MCMTSGVTGGTALLANNIGIKLHYARAIKLVTQV